MDYFHGDEVTFSETDIEIAKRLEQSVRDRFLENVEPENALFAKEVGMTEEQSIAQAEIQAREFAAKKNKKVSAVSNFGDDTKETEEIRDGIRDWYRRSNRIPKG